jgi:uncharacterized membrane protein
VIVFEIEAGWRASMSRSVRLSRRIVSGIKVALSFAERKADVLIFVFIALYVLIFSGYTIYMYYGFKTYAWDLGVFAQSLWTTLNRGKLFYYTIELSVNPSGSFLGTHFSPILFLIVPIYGIFQSPLTLLVLQSFIIGLAALPLYWIAKNKLNSKLWGLTLASSFLLNPALQGMNSFDFHVEAFIPLFFFFAFYFLDNNQWIKGIIFCLLTLSTIEFAPILIAFLGLYFVVKKNLWASKTSMRARMKRVSIPLLLVIIAFVWFFIAFSVTYAINPVKSNGLPGNWDNWGTSIRDVILNVVKNPVRAVEVMVNPIDKVYYFAFIFVPVVFLPFLAPAELLLVLPWGLAASLSEYSPYYQPYFQYFGFIAAQIYIAAVFGAKRLSNIEFGLRENHLEWEKKLMVLILIVSLISCVAVSPIGLPLLTSRPVEINAHTQALEDVLSLVPSNASIATQNDIESHLAQRENIFILTWPMNMNVDYIVVDLTSSQILYGPPGASSSPLQALHAVLYGGQYGVIAYADGVLLLRKGYSGGYVLHRPYQRTFTYKDLNPASSDAVEIFDGSSRSGTVIIHRPNDQAGLVWYGPNTWLFTGDYNVTFRLKAESKSQNITLDVFASSWDFGSNTWAGKIVAEKTFDSSDFAMNGNWVEFTLNFNVDGLRQMEFRGFCLTNNASFALDAISVVQLAQ